MTIKKHLVVKQPIVGQFIREFRGLMGLTQKGLASELNVALLTVSRWENQHSNPSPLAMEKIERKLGDMGERGKDLLLKYFL